MVVSEGENYDFIVGFTLFNNGGFKTRYKHFNNLETAKLFLNNVNLKDSSKIYVDLDLYQKEKEKYENAKDMYIIKNKSMEENYISKDKIRAKIKEIEYLIDSSQGCMDKECLEEYYSKIKFCRELLEEE